MKNKNKKERIWLFLDTVRGEISVDHLGESRVDRPLSHVRKPDREERGESGAAVKKQRV